MEYTNEILEEINFKKLNYNVKYSRWYWSMAERYNSSKYKKRSDRINDCLNLWHWDKYEKNELLDLQKVNRCMNNRFCPNCKLLDISKFIHKFRNVYEEYSDKGYKFYMLTLTVPNCSAENLRTTIDKLNKSFRTFTEKFTYDLSNRKSYQDRYFCIDGGIKVLEINFSEKRFNIDKNGFHPHFHCVVMIKDSIDNELLEKNIKCGYSTKRESIDYKSTIDFHIGKLWSMIWYGDKLTKENIDNTIYHPLEVYYDEENDKKCLQVDFKELDESGIYEVFKYTFKDTDIKNYFVFSNLVQALENKRIRQGFGLLHNMKCEDIEEGEIQELSLEIEENPVSLLTYEINELVTTYRNYKKISRFNRQIDNNIK